MGVQISSGPKTVQVMLREYDRYKFGNMPTFFGSKVYEVTEELAGRLLALDDGAAVPKSVFQRVDAKLKQPEPEPEPEVVSVETEEIVDMTASAGPDEAPEDEDTEDTEGLVAVEDLEEEKPAAKKKATRKKAARKKKTGVKV